MTTEGINPDTAALDTLDTAALVRAFADDQLAAVAAVQRAAGSLARAVDGIAARLERGGRLLYAGAGTSGRLAYLDASELTPTFSWPPERARVAMAGGRDAVFRSKEGAEDDADLGASDLRGLEVTPLDALIGIAASGRTPYVLGALRAAREAGALTVALSNNPDAPVLSACDLPVLLETGPEVISGSTRLKAGTAQKIALNTISSAVMVRLHKVYGNLMVDMQASNHKLLERAVRLTRLAASTDETTARATLEACGWHVKTAVVMVRRGLEADAARALLERHGGDLRAALESD